MTSISSVQSDTFKIGGDIQINRLSFGAMRITGPGVWGESADRPEALRTLKRLPELAVNFVDTSDAYGPDVSEELIRRFANCSEVQRLSAKETAGHSGGDLKHI
jgi:pyridoxine 4-dehydrogenase